MNTIIEPTPELRAAAEQVRDMAAQISSIRAEIQALYAADAELDVAAAKMIGLRARLELLEARLARRRDSLRDGLCTALRAEHLGADLRTSHHAELLRRAKTASEQDLVRSHGAEGRALARQVDSIAVVAARRELREAEQVRDQIHALRRRVDEAYEQGFKPILGEEWRHPGYVRPDFEAALDELLDGLLAAPVKEGPLKRALKKIVAAA
jgi:hypothetical protein